MTPASAALREPRPRGPIAIVGGAGFIGSNLANSFLSQGDEVVIYDNLSRPGVEKNLAWLQMNHGARVKPVIADVADLRALRGALRDARAVFHFAAQVAVTTSLTQPIDDFLVNGRGTLHVLEALRSMGRRVPVIYSSTNKVYGGLADLIMTEDGDRYQPLDEAVRTHGVSEQRPLDFCTPYGCSKGVADQYVLDYAKSYDMPTAVLRMSCIYGPRQFGTEDQGWIAHFLVKALAGEPITLCGNGKQVRDVLHVSDAVGAYRRILARIDRLKGQAFNLGGGPANAVSLRMVLRAIAAITGREPETVPSAWRTGDQFYFVADTRKLRAATGWSAQIGWREGLADLAAWLTQSAAERDGAVADHPRRRMQAGRSEGERVIL
jgi:CDP-paratose 2-epimerase